MKPKLIVALLYPGCLSLDVIGPIEAFNYAIMQAVGQPPYQLFLAAEAPGPVESLSGVQLVAHRSIHEIQEPIDTLLVPGALTGDHRYKKGELLGWLRKTAPTVRRITSICSGALIMGEAGLLSGKRVTTHWMDSADLKKLVPTADVQSDQIFVCDGNVYSSGGVTAGIDLALSMIEEDLGHAEALKIAKRMIVPLKRAGNQTQFSELLLAQANASRFSPLLDWLETRISKATTINDMANQCAMSDRNFSRQFSAEQGISPMQYLKRRRLEVAKLLLEQTDKSLKSIARDVGLETGDKLRRQFQESYSIGPGAYRKRFGVKS